MRCPLLLSQLHERRGGVGATWTGHRKRGAGLHLHATQVQHQEHLRRHRPADRGTHLPHQVFQRYQLQGQSAANKWLFMCLDLDSHIQTSVYTHSGGQQNSIECEGA